MTYETPHLTRYGAMCSVIDVRGKFNMRTKYSLICRACASTFQARCDAMSCSLACRQKSYRQRCNTMIAIGRAVCGQR
jgi:hypothetical protein